MFYLFQRKNTKEKEMNNERNETVNNAAYIWEIGMIKHLYENGVIDKIEYDGILKIINQNYNKNNLCCNC